MKKRLFDIIALVVLIIDAILLLLGSIVEGFNFKFITFLDVLFLSLMALNYVGAFVQKSVVRGYFGGLFFLASGISMLATFGAIKVLAIILVIVIAIAITALINIFIRKGRKWDAGDNE